MGNGRLIPFSIVLLDIYTLPILMTPIEELITIAQNMETVLEEDYGAEGKGLHEKASSVERKISPEAMRKIRYIATIRNKAIHDDIETAEKEIENVRTAAKAVYKEFQKKNPRRKYKTSAENSMVMSIVQSVLKMAFPKFFK